MSRIDTLWNDDRPVLAVVGGQYGDEGKGKILDLLASKADVAVRAQGGDNAGHTVINEKGTFALHLVPSAIFDSQVVNIIGHDVAVNPDRLRTEVEDLQKRGVSTDQLRISSRAPIVLEEHIEIDKALEEFKGKGSIGTTLRGIAYAYIDQLRRDGPRMGDLRSKDRFMAAIKTHLAVSRHFLNLDMLPQYIVDQELRPEFYEARFDAWNQALAPQIVDTQVLIQDELRHKSKILIEGAQGALLDRSLGTYPFVTTSATDVSGLLKGAGIPANSGVISLGVFKSFVSKVGGGPFPTRMEEAIETPFRDKTGERGTTTGRDRSLGWFDSVAAKHSNSMNNYDAVVFMKGDMMDGFDEVKIAEAYIVDRKLINDLPDNAADLANCRPVYRYMPGWQSDMAGISEWGRLPRKFRQYCEAMRDYTGGQIIGVGTGPERSQFVFR